MRLVFKTLAPVVVIFFLAAFLTALLAAFLILDKTPSTAAYVPLSSEQAKHASKFITRISKKILSSRDTVTLEANQHELSGAINLLSQATKTASGSAVFKEDIVQFSGSIKIHVLGWPRFINAKAELQSSTQGFTWKKGQLGSISLSDSLGNKCFSSLVKIMLGKSYGSDLLASIGQVDIADNTLTVDFKPPPGFQSGIAEAAQRLSMYSGKPLNFNSQRVQHYLEHLVDFTRSRPQENTSLALYLQAIFEEARRQTEQHNFSPDEENTSALYALTVQTAPGFFRYFVSSLSVRRLNATYQPRLTLNSRHDLAQHFVYSAGLHILAKKGVSFSLGEMKEMIDASAGGSGFSFADLAADRAGIKLSELAISEAKNAAMIQKVFSHKIQESDFFPDKVDWPEGLNEADFKRQFGSIQSTEYQLLIKKIDELIEQGLIYQISST